MYNLDDAPVSSRDPDGPVQSTADEHDAVVSDRRDTISSSGSNNGRTAYYLLSFY